MTTARLARMDPMTATGDIGHPGLLIGGNTYGFYCANNSQNTDYSNPFGTPPTNRYDTWGPSVTLTTVPPYPSPNKPPYQPLWAGPDGKPAAGGLGSPGSDDFAPLTAIKITIRFYDVTSNQVRDISEVFSLAYKQ